MNEEIEKRIEKLNVSVSNLKANKVKYIFCLPDVSTPSASIYEIYFHATTLKNEGYEVIMLTEKKEFQKPYWIENELTDLKHLSMEESGKLTVSAEDFMIIPDIFSNIMEQTKNLPCTRIGLLQSLDYMLNGLIPGAEWLSFGVKNVITTSKTLKDHFETYYGDKKYNVSVYDIGIPEYFTKSEKPQQPIVSIVGRNSNDISKFVKLFYARYPQYSWVTFDPLLTQTKPPQMLRRIDFANRLKNNFAAVWIDRIASFGTFPLECMKSGVIPISLVPDLVPEYLINRDENQEIGEINYNAGVWTNNYYELPILVGEYVTKFLDDNIDDKIYNDMEEVVEKYTSDNSENMILTIYNELIVERINELSEITKKLNEIEDESK